LVTFATPDRGEVTYHVIDTQSGKPLFSLHNSFKEHGKLFSGGVALSPDGKWFAVAHHISSSPTDSEVTVWEVATAKCKARRVFELRNIKAIAFSPDCVRLGLATIGLAPIPGAVVGYKSTGREVKMWDFLKDTEIGKFPTQKFGDFVTFSPMASSCVREPKSGTSIKAKNDSRCLGAI
jgi:WD40 repeat protein